MADFGKEVVSDAPCLPVVRATPIIVGTAKPRHTGVERKRRTFPIDLDDLVDWRHLYSSIIVYRAPRRAIYEYHIGLERLRGFGCAKQDAVFTPWHSGFPWRFEQLEEFRDGLGLLERGYNSDHVKGLSRPTEPGVCCLTESLVNQFAGQVERGVGEEGERPPGGAGKPSQTDATALFRIAVIRQCRSRGAKVVLERDQSRLIDVGPTQVEHRRPALARVLNDAPEQEWHAAQAVLRRIGAAILVVGGVLERQRQDARHGLRVLSRHVDRDPVSQV